MPATFTCSICNDIIVQGEMFEGFRNGQSVTACFDCYIDALDSFEFDGESIYYTAPGRELDLNDWVVYYDKDGTILTKTTVSKLKPGKMTATRQTLASELGLPPEDIAIVIEVAQ